MKTVTEMTWSELDAEMGRLGRTSGKVPSWPFPPTHPEHLSDYNRLKEVVDEVVRRCDEEDRNRAALERMEEFHEKMGMGRVPA